jgi:beta-lactamase regulating signal transducer with metallopeptidase domain
MFALFDTATFDIYWIGLVVKITFILASAWFIHYAIPSKRAQWRVVGWRVCLACLLILPFINGITPKLAIPILENNNYSRIVSEQQNSILYEQKTTSNAHDIVIKDPNIATSNATAKSTTSLRTENTQNLSITETVLISIVVLWLLGIILLFIYILYHQYKLIHDIANSKPADEATQKLCDGYTSRLEMSNYIRVRVSPKTEVPYIYGCMHPMIVLPERMNEERYRSDLPAVFAHELSHIQNNDLLWMACFRLLQAFLWIHPLVWGVRRTHEKACEYACDERAAHVLGSTDQYAGTLAKIALEISNQEYSLNAAPMVRSSKIASRLKRVENGIPYFPLSFEWIVCFILFWGVVVISASVLDLAYANEPIEIAKTKEISDSANSDSALNQNPLKINQPGKTLDSKNIDSRDSKTDDNLIDLSDYYNAGLIGTWQTVNSVQPDSLKTLNNDLANLPAGIQTFDNTRFDIRGIVQLIGSVMEDEGAEFPEQVSHIPVNQSFKTVYVLHATSWQEKPGTHIGSYILNYTDGTNHEFKIVYGTHLLDWWRYRYEPSEFENTVIAWKGSNQMAKEIVKYQRKPTRARIQAFIYSHLGMSVEKQKDAINAGYDPIRLFKTAWKNPKPDKKVQSIDYVSTMSNCAPFLVAMTVE